MGGKVSFKVDCVGLCVNNTTAPFHPSRYLPGSHLSLVFGRALRGVLKLLKPSLVQILSPLPWELDPEMVGKEGGKSTEFMLFPAAGTINDLSSPFHFGCTPYDISCYPVTAPYLPGLETKSYFLCDHQGAEFFP